MGFIAYGTQTIEDDDIVAVVEALRSPALTGGKYIASFEQALCRETGAKYAVAVANGTAALHVACMTMGISKGDEVITTPITFAASANCVLYCGGTPVFADIDPDTMLIDIADIERKITSQTEAIIPVHFGGELCNMDAISQLADKYGLQILQDCAHSLGSTINEKNQGEFNGQQIWSFHPVKTITTGEGGAVTTNDENIYKKLLRYRSHGITRDISQYVGEDEGDWYYEMLDLGFNYRITDIQSALGISQLKKLGRFAKRRAEIVARYNEAFSALPLQIQKSPKWSNPVRHIYTIRVQNATERKGIFDKLKTKNIGANVHYIPIYLLPYYQKLGYKRGLCPIAEDSYSRLITIPLYPKMTDEQVEYVIKTVTEVCT
jgi:UDP-4-amino-4,6-dideoxy-N-acetyl-beta-L-altrosamine transaminase